MRVCQIISGDQWAGAEVMNYRLLKELKKYGDIELSSILLNEGRVAEEIREAGIPVAVVDEAKTNTFGLIGKVNSAVKGFLPDIVHSHRLKENVLAYQASGFSGNVRLVCTQHGMPEPLDSKLSKAKRFLLSKYHRRILDRHFHRIVAVSEDMRRYLVEECGFPQEKVPLIHNGTELPPADTFHVPKKDFVVGSAGRLFPVKGYELMVETAHETRKRSADVKFKLAGDGPERDKILKLIKKFELEKVFSLTGFVEDMSGFYSNLDLYINTSFHEGLPMTILEAMSHRVPVIATKTGGMEEIYQDGVHGYLVGNRNPAEFADRITRLYLDRELRIRMGEKSRKRIENEFSANRMAEKYFILYKNL